MKLFIFGNGFDRAHNLPTKYCQFREWLIKKYGVCVEDEEIDLPDYRTNYKGLEGYDEKQFANFFVHLIDDADSNSEIEDKWCCFEEDLAKLRWELILDSVEYEYDDENDFDPWKTENKLSIKAQTCGDSNHILRTYFREWITYINELINEMGDDSKKPFFQKVFGDSDKYLTFNYTNTLEQLYKIKNVCHIHGSIAKWEELIFGHCDPGYPQKDFKEYEYNAYEIFERIYKGYIKDTKKQIERNSEFFNSINGVDEIYLFGLSFGDVDAPYFRHVFKICQQLKTINLNVFEAGQYDSIMTKLKEYGAKCDIKKWIVE